MSDNLNSYPTVFNLGHKAIEGIFDGMVEVQEKVDGSQFSFGIRNDKLVMRSKRVELELGGNHGMFTPITDYIETIIDRLTPGWVYRGEFLSKPKHNVLRYERIPSNHLVLFDIDMTGQQCYVNRDTLTTEAEKLGFDAIPELRRGVVDSVTDLLSFLERTSFLGGSLIEGVVVKRRDLFTMEKKIAIGKYVSEGFKEVHHKEWKVTTRADIVDQLQARYKTEARWDKAVIHLKEEGRLDDSPRDIGPLIREVVADIEKEEKDAIKDELWKYFWPRINKGLTSGLPEWYKEKLLKEAFE